MRLTVSRRQLLASVSAGGTLLLTGCSDDEISSQQTQRAHQLLRDLLAAELAAIDRYERGAAGAQPALAAALAAALADHKRHAAALAERLPAGDDRPSASAPLTSPKPGEMVNFAGLEKALASTAEHTCLKTSSDIGDAVALTASIAASERSHLANMGAVVNGQELSWHWQEPKSTKQRRALQQTLAAEHAASYAYGVIGARLDGSALASVQEIEQQHRGRLETIAEALTSAGVSPTPAAPAYQLPSAVTDSSAALQLAIWVEEHCAQAWRGLAVSSTEDRATAIGGLCQSAIWATRWRSYATPTGPATIAFPGAR